MRAIDAGELKRSIAVSALIEDQKTLEQIIDEQPTIEERKKGKWIDAQYPFSKCSICGCYFDTANNEAKFCPNCGADMRGEQE